MSPILSRRSQTFIGYLVLFTAGQLLAEPAQAWSLERAQWTEYGRVETIFDAQEVEVRNGFLASSETVGDFELTVQVKAGDDETQQVWLGFRAKSRFERYALGIRAGEHQHIYLARYMPHGHDRFLGFTPFRQPVRLDAWNTVRVLGLGKKIRVFWNDEPTPLLEQEDEDAPWAAGAIVLGGGYQRGRFRGLTVRAIPAAEKAQLEKALRAKKPAEPAANEERRKQMRAAYAPQSIPGDKTIQVVSLDGNWLFMPDQELSPHDDPTQLGTDDQAWHVMAVPQFWTPSAAWLHGERQFNEVKTPVAQMKGISDLYYQSELDRLNRLTFDWRKTQGGWYRHVLELPPTLLGKRLELQFAAIALVSEVWCNGVKVASHQGMFGEIRCDISSAARPGKNVIVVHTRRQTDEEKNTSDKLVGIAVTVEVTQKMLKSLPKAFYGNEPGGIWQPVQLKISEPVHLEDVYFKPTTRAAHLEITLRNGGENERPVAVRSRILAGARVVWEAVSPVQPVAAAQAQVVRMETPELPVEAWSPEKPTLYQWEITVLENGQPQDRSVVEVGFREFKVVGNQFYLNGSPYWLRGTSLFSNHLAPNDRAVAQRMVALAKEANVNAVRIHVAPMTTAWAQAMDQQGMLVSYEGIWPWLMLPPMGIPSEELLTIWRQEFLSLVKKYRNHPSIVIWTVNNEMKFHHETGDQELLLAKWKVVDQMIRQIRALDPTRPIVADSDYVRGERPENYRNVVGPAQIDDGDIDDFHRYFGWYNDSFMNLIEGGAQRDYIPRIATPNRPLFSQELSTGYPRNDDGHPTRSYLFKHQTPQALVGLYSYEDQDPHYFLSRQALMTKELTEALRRYYRPQIAGLMPFAFVSWVKHPVSAQKMAPLPAWEALKTAMQPVLVSAELKGRHFYAEDTASLPVTVINDDVNARDLPAGTIVAKWMEGERVIGQSSAEIGAVRYYTNETMLYPLKVPHLAAGERKNLQLVLEYSAGGQRRSVNSYATVVADRAWGYAQLQAETRSRIVVLGDADLAQVFGLSLANTLSDALAQQPLTLLIRNRKMNKAEIEQLKRWVEKGGRVVVSEPGPGIQDFIPSVGFKAKRGEIATFYQPESPAFDQLEPLDLAWFQETGKKVPLVCAGVYTLPTEDTETERLAYYCDIHGYLRTPSEIDQYEGYPLIKQRLGAGEFWFSEFRLPTTKRDPVADRLLFNLLRAKTSLPAL